MPCKLCESNISDSYKKEMRVIDNLKFIWYAENIDIKSFHTFSYNKDNNEFSLYLNKKETSEYEKSIHSDIPPECNVNFTIKVLHVRPGKKTLSRLRYGSYKNGCLNYTMETTMLTNFDTVIDSLKRFLTSLETIKDNMHMSIFVVCTETQCVVDAYIYEIVNNVRVKLPVTMYESFIKEIKCELHSEYLFQKAMERTFSSYSALSKKK